MKKILSLFEDRKIGDTHEVFHDNEIKTNRFLFFSTIAAIIIITVYFSIFVFFYFESTVVPRMATIIEFTVCVTIAVISCIYYLIFKGENSKSKYVQTLALVLIAGEFDCMLTSGVFTLIFIPIILTSRYCSRGFSLQISLFSFLILFAVSTVDSLVLIQLSNASMDMESVISVVTAFISVFLMRLPLLIIGVIIADILAKQGRNHLLEQEEITEEAAKTKAELETATQIQASQLPNTFPAFPEKTEFDIFAHMTPAKEVGGDFYDFFLIDDDHLGIVIADVSDKGVPAALFMMMTKNLIYNLAMTGLSPAQTLTAANNQICARNPQEMFVTVWFGILTISSGKLVASNAGHEKPIITGDDGNFEMLADKRSLVIGGMEGISYKDYTIELKKGSKLFIYTDGVPEAENSENEMFGLERTVEVLNTVNNETPQAIINTVNNAIGYFIGNAPAFDDLTMLCLSYNGHKKSPTD